MFFFSFWMVGWYYPAKKIMKINSSLGDGLLLVLQHSMRISPKLYLKIDEHWDMFWWTWWTIFLISISIYIYTYYIYIYIWSWIMYVMFRVSTPLVVPQSAYWSRPICVCSSGKDTTCTAVGWRSSIRTPFRPTSIANIFWSMDATIGFVERFALNLGFTNLRFGMSWAKFQQVFSSMFFFLLPW